MLRFYVPGHSVAKLDNSRRFLARWTVARLGGQAMCQLDATSSTKLFFSWPLICKGQVWRLVTNFFYFGALDVHFLFHMYFLVSVSVDTARKGLSSRHYCSTDCCSCSCCFSQQ